jgi:hypothetical protein
MSLGLSPEQIKAMQKRRNKILNVNIVPGQSTVGELFNENLMTNVIDVLNRTANASVNRRATNGVLVL